MKNRRILAMLLAAILLLATAAPAMADDVFIEVEGGAEEIAELDGIDLSQLGDGESISGDEGAGAEVPLDQAGEAEETFVGKAYGEIF